MKPEIAKLWVEALRSGKYKQTKNKLATSEGFCCLGVLCDVAVKNGLSMEVEESGIIAGRRCTIYAGSGTYLPSVVREWSGIKSSAGEYGPGYESRCLSDDNDRGDTFEMIASTIEARVEQL